MREQNIRKKIENRKRNQFFSDPPRKQSGTKKQKEEEHNVLCIKLQRERVPREERKFAKREGSGRDEETQWNEKEEEVGISVRTYVCMYVCTY